MSGYVAYIMESCLFSDMDIFKKCLGKVSKYRQIKIDRLVRLEDKINSLAAGILFSYAVNEYFGENEKTFAYETRKPGKPYIIGKEHIQFSISHTDGFVAVVTGDYECGIDIERIRKFPDSIVQRLYSDSDRTILSTLKDGMLYDVYASCIWTRREAYSKMTGTGILMKDINQERVMEDCFASEQQVALWNEIHVKGGDFIFLDRKMPGNDTETGGVSYDYAAAVCVKNYREDNYNKIKVIDPEAVIERFMFHN